MSVKRIVFRKIALTSSLLELKDETGADVRINVQAGERINVQAGERGIVATGAPRKDLPNELHENEDFGGRLSEDR